MAADAVRSVADLIRRDHARLTQHERLVAQRLLADYPVAGLDTVARFGKAAGVSGPTVLRMITKIGFKSYRAFQDALRTELGARLETPLMKGGNFSVRDPLGLFAEVAIANIRQTAANVAHSEFDEVVRLFSDSSRTVHLLGGRFTDSIAHYLLAHLRPMRPNVRHITGDSLNRLDQLPDIKKRDVVAIFDVRRYSTDIASFATHAVKRGTTIVLFTDQWLSPVSRIAKHVLSAHVTAPSMWDSSAGLLVLVESLLAVVAHELGSKAQTRLALIEKLRYEQA